MFKTSIGLYTAELYATPAPNVTLFTSDDNDKTMVVFFLCVRYITSLCSARHYGTTLFKYVCFSLSVSSTLGTHTHPRQPV